MERKLLQLCIALGGGTRGGAWRRELEGEGVHILVDWGQLASWRWVEGKIGRALEVGVARRLRGARYYLNQIGVGAGVR